MRSGIIAILMVALVAACSREAANEEAPLAEAPAAEPAFSLALTSAEQLTLPEGSPIRISAGGGGLTLRGHLANPSSQLRTEGASFALGAENEAAFSGQRVRVTFSARGVDGATEFHTVYSTHGDGNSGWRRLRVNETMRDVAFEFNVPQVGRARDDFIGINPPAAGAVEIQAVRVEILPSAAAAAPDDGASAEDDLRP